MRAPFFMKLRPEALSSTGTEQFELIEVIKAKSNGHSCYKLRVLTYGGEDKLVRLVSTTPASDKEIELAKSVLKTGMTVAIVFDDLSVQSYKFNNSSGLSLYANDFHVVKEVIEIPVALNSLDNIELIKMCMMYNIDKNEAITYRLHNTNLTDNQIIMHYKPDLAENILGELVPISQILLNKI